jgi:hypothetical protein
MVSACLVLSLDRQNGFCEVPPGSAGDDYVVLPRKRPFISISYGMGVAALAIAGEVRQPGLPSSSR